MKIYDLIAVLEQFDPQMEVSVYYDGNEEYWRSKDLYFGIIRHEGKLELHIDSIQMGEPAKYTL